MRKVESKDKFCGECCWFYAEDTYGFGVCPFCFGEMATCDEACRKPVEYVSKEEMRHHMAVLLQHNRWRRSNEVPNHCKPVNPKELGEAIDFACKYMKVFSEL